MADNRTGSVWPLGLLFVLTLCGGGFGVVWPLMGGTFDIRVAGLLLVAAFFSGALLYIPNWVIARKIPNLPTLTGSVADIRTALLGAGGNENKLDAITAAIDKLSKQLKTISDRQDADGDRKKLDTIEAKLPKQT